MTIGANGFKTKEKQIYDFTSRVLMWIAMTIAGLLLSPILRVFYDDPMELLRWAFLTSMISLMIFGADWCRKQSQ